MLITIAAIIISYFIGAFPHLYLLCRLLRISTAGDRHINLWQGAGPVWGLVAIFIDVLKGAIAIWLAGVFGLDLAIVVSCGLVAVAGQMWPVFSRFNGEKGNTTGLGIALALAYQPTLIALVPVLFGLISKLVRLLKIKGQPVSQRFKSGAEQSNTLPLGVALTLLLLPLFSYFLGEPREVVLGFVGLLILIMLRRITSGLTKDLRAKRELKSVICNRILYDRSQY